MSTITVAAVASPSKKDKLLEDNCNADMDDFTTSSIFEFLNKERDCYNADDDGSELDVESLFEEINRLSDNTDDRSIDEIIREAEMLLADPQPHMIEHEPNVMNNKNNSVRGRASGVVSGAAEPAPACAVKCDSPGADDGEVKKTDERGIDEKQTKEASRAALKQHIAAMPLAIVPDRTETGFKKVVDAVCPDSVISEESTPKGMRSDDDDSPTLDISDSIGVISLQIDEPPSALVLDASRTFTSPINRNRQPSRRNSFEPTPRSFTPCSASSSPQLIQNAKIIDRSRSIPIEKSFCDRSTNPSPTHAVANATTSPIQNNISISREYALKHEIDVLQEKLKDTEERLQSLRIQHDSLSTIHRDLRESHARLQEESELLKLDVQHLNECANILRNELQSARNDRNEALDVQKLLQTELDESRGEKKKALEQCDKDARTIQDLQRQCREMERILMRKHPDSVSALIVASKNPAKNNDNSASRRLLEQRIAQLESDAKDQDHKAQKILANVQARFNSVQSKYETHIADLETQVLSLQEINTKLNEKIETEIRLLNNPCKDENGYISNSTQTDNLPEKDPNTTVKRTSSTQTDTSRPNSNTLTKIPSNRKLQMNKMSVSHSDTTISGNHAAAKEDAHLLATLRGMRIDLALKDKETQRLTRELEECKKTIKKLQREKEVMKNEKPSSASSSSSTSRKLYDPNQFTEHSADGQALKEALNKIKLLQNDYKILHDKRLQDLKTLQSAHEREMASSQESVRALQQRLSERDEAFATQKRRKVPIDYYALKAKVSSLERRHSEREERLHMLVEALSKGRINGALDEILTENDQ